MKNKEFEKESVVFLTELLKMLGVEGTIVSEESSDEEGHQKVKINIETEESSLLIGYHGETLNSIQHILNTAMFKKYGEGTSVLVDVSDYRKKREEKLIQLADSAATKAKFIDKPIALYPMNSYERKIIHERVSTIDGVTSESEGENENRRVIISPASNL